MKPKILALYLPQFHTFPENDAWWGTGFTDWTNVRKAQKLYSWHNQPRVPLDKNYYDLSKVDTLRWQAELANKYDVYGFCFYHYWFNGKLLLHKPAEMLLANKDIPMRFCFSWANEPWARTWDGRNTDVLMPQSYGNERDWKAHFDYLLPFFKDERYIKENGKPMFTIYRTRNIPCINEMMELWEKLAIEAGFEGIHFVCTLCNAIDLDAPNNELPFNAFMEFEPLRCLDFNGYSLWQKFKVSYMPKINKMLGTKFKTFKPYSFKEVSKMSMQNKSPKGSYGGIFLGWDNTPRKKEAGLIIKTPTRDEFAHYLDFKINQTLNEYGTEYLFVNAWNEWAEGTYLEPDTTTQYMFLEEIKKAVGKYSVISC